MRGGGGEICGGGRRCSLRTFEIWGGGAQETRQGRNSFSVLRVAYMSLT
jgi:hypothetical protein